MVDGRAEKTAVIGLPVHSGHGLQRAVGARPDCLGLREHPAKKGLPFNIFVTVLEIGGSITLFHLAQRMGASDVVSYLVGSIAPVLGGFAIWIRARKFSGASAAIFAFTFISAVIALVGSSSPKVLLYKDCAATGSHRSGLLGLMRPSPQTRGVLLGSTVWNRRYP